MKNIIITGCTSGLGKSLYQKAIERNKYNVFSHGRNFNADLIGDISDSSFPNKFLNFLIEKKIDVFINNAAVYFEAPIDKTLEIDIENLIRVNVVSQIILIKKAFEVFKKNKHGLIININSLAGINPSKNESIYCSSKFALRGFSKSLQLESIGTGVEIIDVYSGGIKTKITQNRRNYNSLMESDEVADQVLDLILDKKYYVNEIVLRKRNESSYS